MPASVPGFVLVTGASSGIGRALAHEFSRHSHSVILVGRDSAALEAARVECEKLGAPRVLVLAEDLGAPGASTRVFERLSVDRARVDTLVNNAGSGAHGRFVDIEMGRQLAITRVQIESMMELTQLFLRQLEGRPGSILNVSSVYAYAPAPYQAVYGATKAFMLSFSEALAHELHGTGTQITVLCPGSTRTEFRRRANAGEPSGCPPEAVARAGYRALARGRFVCVPGPHNWLYTTIINHLPHALRARAVQMINSRRGLKANH